MAQQSSHQAIINNDFYQDLGEGWYTADDHPIALLRSENATRAPWVDREITQHVGTRATVLDVGCGAGFLSNYLALQGHEVTGIDISSSSLEVAKLHDKTARVKYLYGNAYELPFDNGSFDVVCAMDILEHIDKPFRLIQEASRVLRPGGLFFFHTFNRTWMSNLIVIKGVDWFVPNAPKNMHVYDLFIKPDELRLMCEKASMNVEAIFGFMPTVRSLAFWKLLFTRKIAKDFSFNFVKSISTGYCGFASKKSFEI